jgi:hypothetical protein
MTTTEPDSLAFDCPFCGAAKGDPCRTHRGRGRELNWPHSRRISLVHHTQEIPPVRALCCECGNSRTCKEPRNKRGYWGHPDWHREIGDLKCSACDRVTAHALLKDEDYGHRDYEEQMQQVALGAEIPKGWNWDADRLRRTYREGHLPRNPYLHHRWWTADRTKARAAGESQVTSLCGEVVVLPESDSEIPPSDDLAAPGEVRDMDYEDTDSRLWWVDMDCVDCLRVSNVKKLARIRNELMRELLHLAARTDDLDASEVTQIPERINLRRSEGHRTG